MILGFTAVAVNIMESCTTAIASYLEVCAALVSVLTVTAPAAWLACLWARTFIACVCLRGFPALVSDCLCMPKHHVSL